MIEPIEKGHAANVPRVRVTCDQCGRVECVTCDYERRGRDMAWLPNEGQVHRKMIGQYGWELVKGKLWCPACKAGRKTRKKEGDMTDTPGPGLREPTARQEREIIGLLLAEYDEEAGRYRGTATDATLSEVVGGGCLPGWVTHLRERYYPGGSGDNEDIGSLHVDVRARLAECDRALATMRDVQARADVAIKGLADQRAEIARIDRRLTAIVKAVGPKAGVA